MLYAVKLIAVNKSFASFVRGLLFWLPIEGKPVRALSLVVAFFFGLFALTASIVIRVIPGPG